MELEIMVVYIGPYQEYTLRSDSMESIAWIDPVIMGYRFMASAMFPRAAIKNMRTFKVFPTIREALMDAVYDWRGVHIDLDHDEQLDYIEINGVRHKPEDIPKILNFI